MIISSLQRVAQMMDAQHIDAAPVLDVGSIDRTEIGQNKDIYESSRSIRFHNLRFRKGTIKSCGANRLTK